MEIIYWGAITVGAAIGAGLAVYHAVKFQIALRKMRK